MVLFGTAMWGVSRSSFGLTQAVHYLGFAGFAFGLSGVLVIAAGIREFSRLKTTVNPLDLTESTQLATGSIYRFTRNPMYLGMALILVGWGLYLQSTTNVLLVLGFMMLITQWQIKPEEAALRKLFGDEYETYCTQVRRWL